ncbi:MAG: D-ribose pyranase [Thermoanaerobacteraceae bacterium]|jgi:D-ribose pyranase|uniref:D-ribose pyranase n=1 Tax=Biomaibacter acetigenes TaxID=2316383 RepID=A0A3G2R2U1_9FIRM|nr:D-ribose pyranase [Biomaibacter acetigenes]AYO29804.1 D-ribose pyranase [Biomaibacter acetigenes]MDK2878308.1 D-ribose pyranase [Thermoanaerobacteraceae bacterium]MDN5311333.1 D-ribose pyranase [Thermoanaerobacteraceae bacterium]RKL64444.1 D-ribose pyranase [Thermoanaerobacteraceae bacterium SP2]
MKKGGILNKRLNEVIASLGHMDTIVICDAGLPIPDENQRVDLAFEPGTPGQIQVLKAVLNEVVVEKVIMAEESKKVSPEMHEEILKLLGDKEIEYVPHTEFKERSKKSKAIIRTGEFTPYSNVMLVCGCAY